MENECTYDEYIIMVKKTVKLSAIKEDILRVLYEGERLSLDEIITVIGKNFGSRRIRELRQAGIDIRLDGKKYYLGSTMLSKNKIRKYLTSTQRRKLFEKNKWSCSVCGIIHSSTADARRGLQPDHKIPIDKGGTNETENWQPLCHNCNISKKRACEGCELSCKECAWAFPEVVGIKVITNMSPQVISFLKMEAQKEGITFDKLLNKTLRDHFSIGDVV